MRSKRKEGSQFHRKGDAYLRVVGDCFLRPIMRNSISGKLRVRRFTDIHED